MALRDVALHGSPNKITRRRITSSKYLGASTAPHSIFHGHKMRVIDVLRDSIFPNEMPPHPIKKAKNPVFTTMAAFVKPHAFTPSLSCRPLVAFASISSLSALGGRRRKDGVEKRTKGPQNRKVVRLDAEASLTPVSPLGIVSIVAVSDAAPSAWRSECCFCSWRRASPFKGNP